MVPQNGWFISWKSLIKWMIWGVQVPPFIGDTPYQFTWPHGRNPVVSHLFSAGCCTELHGRNAQWCRPRYSTRRCESIPLTCNGKDTFKIHPKMGENHNISNLVRAWMIEKSEFQSDFVILPRTCSKVPIDFPSAFPISSAATTFLPCAKNTPHFFVFWRPNASAGDTLQRHFDLGFF